MTELHDLHWLSNVALRARAVMLAERGAVTAAIASLGAIRDPDGEEALAAIAALVPAEALAAAIAPLAEASGDEVLIGMWAIARARLGDPGGAVQLLGSLIRRGHRRWMRTLGEIALLHLDAPALAADALATYLSDQPDDVEAWLRLAGARAAGGDVAAAHAALDEARGHGIPARLRAIATDLADHLATAPAAPAGAGATAMVLPPEVAAELRDAAAAMGAAIGEPAVVTITGLVLARSGAADDVVLVASAIAPPWQARARRLEVAGVALWLARLIVADGDPERSPGSAWPIAPTPWRVGDAVRRFAHDGTEAPAWLADALDELTSAEGLVPSWWPRQGSGRPAIWDRARRSEARAWLIATATDHDRALAALGPWLPATVALTRRALQTRIHWRLAAIATTTEERP